MGISEASSSPPQSVRVSIAPSLAALHFSDTAVCVCVSESVPLIAPTCGLFGGPGDYGDVGASCEQLSARRSRWAHGAQIYDAAANGRADAIERIRNRNGSSVVVCVPNVKMLRNDDFSSAATVRVRVGPGIYAGSYYARHPLFPSEDSNKGAHCLLGRTHSCTFCLLMMTAIHPPISTYFPFLQCP